MLGKDYNFFNKSVAAFICVVSVVVLFGEFRSNMLHIADQHWFDNFQVDIDALIVGRMVKSQRDGIFSSGGLTGWALPVRSWETDEAELPGFQYKVYKQGVPFGKYEIYKSHIGGQGMLFSILDKLLKHLPAGERLSIFYSINSLLAALAITMVVFWFYREFGLVVGLFVLASAFLSQWLIVFGRLIWWSFWSFYLPMIVLMFYLKDHMPTSKKQYFKFAMVVFASVLIKCIFAGYEYMTTALIMMVVPFVYYGVKKNISLVGYVKGFSAAVIGSLVAILLTFSILCFQIARVEGSFFSGVNHIIYSYEKRTYADPTDTPADFAATVKASRIGLVYNYMNHNFLDINNIVTTSSPFLSKFVFKVKYLYLIFLFMVFSAYLYIFKGKLSPPADRKRLALLLATWFSIAAPLSWYIVFKAHSFAHQHLNSVLWQMPFTFFGFAVLGAAVKSIMAVKPRPE